MLSHTVRVRLDGGNNQVLHPGQVVTGTVEYKAPAGERLASLHIDFRGVTKIMPKKTATHINTEYIELFHMGESLLAEPILVQSGEKYSWNFSFYLPNETGPDRSHGLYKDSGHSLFDERKHILPPSISPHDTPETKIEYNLYAVAQEQFQNQAIGQVENLQTRPVVNVLDYLKLRPDVAEIPPLEPQVYEKQFTTSQAPKRRFSLRPGNSRSNSVAETGGSFTVVAKIPSVVVPGRDIEIELSISSPDTPHDDTRETAYTHKTTTLALQSLTHRRTAAQPHNPALDITATTKFDTRKAARALPIQPALPLTHRFSTDGISSFPPNFKSYSLARTYKLLLTAIVSFEKQDYEAIFIAPVQIFYLASQDQLQLRRASTAPPPPPPAPAAWERRKGVEDDLPPAYEPRR